MKKSFAESINNAQVMYAGMLNNEAEVAKRGWSVDKTRQELGGTREAAIALNDEQEKLKAQLKMKTAELDAKMAQLDTLMNEARKVVKLGFPQAQWKEFGITDKR